MRQSPEFGRCYKSGSYCVGVPLVGLGPGGHASCWDRSLVRAIGLDINGRLNG